MKRRPRQSRTARKARFQNAQRGLRWRAVTRQRRQDQDRDIPRWLIRDVPAEMLALAARVAEAQRLQRELEAKMSRVEYERHIDAWASKLAADVAHAND